MELNTKEISSLIKKQISEFKNDVSVDDVGVVKTVGDGIALVKGLNSVMANELILFNDEVYGMALNLEENIVGAVIMGDDSLVKEGDSVKRTKRVVEVPVGNEMLGRVVNALGQPIDEAGPIKSTKTRPIERVAPGVMSRESVKQPLQTGIKVIDSMIPIGKGQRELIIGDRQTGKTAIAIDTIINQKGKNVYCIYVAIGQKASTVAQIVEKLRVAGAMEYTTVVVSTASDSSPLQYITPYAGCAIGEEWMEQGKDVLIVYDDLSKHAVAYRAMSLLLRRPPGREAYPGDVFYLHSRLLERAAKLNEDYGGGSLTALPIIETQAGDISAYIPTNVISITDGQLFLQTELFNSGVRPAVDSGLSVSRVGSSAQVRMMKQVSKSMKLELAQYQEMLAFSQFGSDLDPATRSVIEHGKRLTEILKQPQYQPMTTLDQVLVLFAVENGMCKDVEVNDMLRYQDELLHYLHANAKNLLNELEENQSFNEDITEELTDAVDSFNQRFFSEG
ncbi:MAG: F0F1 ATP synthase subunit alpha [Erysipelotrichaceae bacterium]|nr:F0F1 ATP synthase subunit alpha [Erysipelotrichaceae bacterium]